MRSTNLLILVCALFVGSGILTAAAAQSGAERLPEAKAAAHTPAVSLNEQEKLFCRREKPIGSNRAIRVCRTRAQIEAQAEQTREAIRSRGSAARERD